MHRVALPLSLTVMLSAPLALAGDPPPATMRLDYQREPGAEQACPDEQEFRDAMASQVRRPLFDPAATSLLVVRLQKRSGGYQGIAELRDASGAAAWTLPLGPVPRDCSAVADNLALAVAVKVDPRGGKRAALTLVPNPHRLFGVDGEVITVPPPTSPGSPPAPDVAAPPPRTPAPDPEYRVRLGVAGGLAIAASPGWGPSFAVDLGVRWRDRPLSLALEAGFSPPVSGDVATATNVVHVTTYRATVAAVACGYFARALFACGVVAAGALHGTGTAMNLNAQPATLFYAGAGGRAGVELPVHAHVAVRVSGDALVTLAQPVLQIGGTPVYRGSMVTGTATAGLVFTF
jgi:hypothetical protein